jgi:hypothetical protein
MKFFVLAQIIWPVPNIRALVAKIFDPFMECFFVTLETARSGSLKIALVARVADSFVNRFLMLAQSRWRFQNMTADFTGMLAAAMFEPFVNPQRVCFVRDKIAHVAVQRHLDVSLVVNLQIVFCSRGKLALVAVEPDPFVLEPPVPIETRLAGGGEGTLVTDEESARVLHSRVTLQRTAAVGDKFAHVAGQHDAVLLFGVPLQPHLASESHVTVLAPELAQMLLHVVFAELTRGGGLEITAVASVNHARVLHVLVTL